MVPWDDEDSREARGNYTAAHATADLAAYDALKRSVCIRTSVATLVVVRDDPRPPTVASPAGTPDSSSVPCRGGTSEQCESASTAPQVQHLPPLIRHKYFAQNRKSAQPSVTVAPALRELVRFRYLNLMQNFPFAGTFDFIFCRNVMIYFDKPTQELLVNRLCNQLEPGGLLFTGHSESLTGISHGFRYVQPTIYVKQR